MRSSGRVSGGGGGGGRWGGLGVWLVGTKEKLLGLGRESSRWIMNPSSKLLDFVDWLTDCMRGSRSLPGFPRTLQTNHIPFPGWPESWQIPNEALIQTADTVYCTYLHTASIFFRPFFFYFSSVMPGMGTFTKSLHKHTSPTAIV